MITKLFFSNFRNFETFGVELSDGVTVITGKNASGKTNILESIYLLSTGKSFKARLEKEVIKYGKDIASVTGIINGVRLDLKITRGDNGWPRKKMLVNGVSRRLLDFAGNFKTVLFGPWDMDLVTSSPSLRRRFLDTVLSQTDREYRRAILSYEKGLRQRNKLLLRIREDGVSRSHLLFWDQLLIKNGDFISKKREEFIKFVNNTNNPRGNEKYQLEYDKSAISEGRLEQYKNEEVAAATTLVGPHRDDFIFKSISDDKSRELASFGSRGEQRMGVLWLKLAELSYIENTSKDKPTLLLDDIFSELDEKHRNIVFEMINNRQIIITTADEHILKDFKKNDIKIFNL